MINNNNLKQLKVLVVMQHKEELLNQTLNKQLEKVKNENQVLRKKNIIVEIVMIIIIFHHNQVLLLISIQIILFNNPIHHNNIHNNQIIMENIKMNYLLN